MITNINMNGGVKRIREFITWNVSWECMNGPHGKCKLCTNVGPGEITMCQDNVIFAFKNLKNRPHFIAIQEGNKKLANRIITALNLTNPSHTWSKLIYQSSSKVTAILIYDKTRFEVIKQFNGNCDDDNGRPFVGGIFREKSIINKDGTKPVMTVVSVHGPHVKTKDYTSYHRKNGKKPILQQIINKYAEYLNLIGNDIIFRNTFFEYPCFIMGDFNVEFKSTYLKSPFGNFRRVNSLIKSCCSFPQSTYPDKRKHSFDNIIFRQNRKGGEGKRVKLLKYGTFKNIKKSGGNVYPNYNFPDNDTGAFRYSRWTSDHLPIAASFEIS